VFEMVQVLSVLTRCGTSSLFALFNNVKIVEGQYLARAVLVQGAERRGLVCLRGQRVHDTLCQP
jgi:hypothetical protein